VQIRQEIRREEECQDLWTQGVQVGQFWLSFDGVAFGKYYQKQVEKINFSGLNDVEKLLAVKIFCPTLTYIQVSISRDNYVFVSFWGKLCPVGSLPTVRQKLEKFFGKLELEAPGSSLYFENFLEPWSPRFEGRRI